MSKTKVSPIMLNPEGALPGQTIVFNGTDWQPGFPTTTNIALTANTTGVGGNTFTAFSTVAQSNVQDKVYIYNVPAGNYGIILELDILVDPKDPRHEFQYSTVEARINKVVGSTETLVSTLSAQAQSRRVGDLAPTRTMQLQNPHTVTYTEYGHTRVIWQRGIGTSTATLDGGGTNLTITFKGTFASVHIPKLSKVTLVNKSGTGYALPEIAGVCRIFGSIVYGNATPLTNKVDPGPPTSLKLMNADSIQWLGSGLYRVNFTNSLPSNQYAVFVQNEPKNRLPDNVLPNTTPGVSWIYQDGDENTSLIMNKTTNSFDVMFWTNESNLKENTSGFSFAVFDSVS